jgi:hypothetical protein
MDRYELLALLVISLFLIPIGYLVFIFVIAPVRFYLHERRHPPKRLDDPVFGTIEFQHGLWTSVPTKALDYLVGVDAPETGPTQAQRDFYTALNQNLPARVAECKAFIGGHDAPPPGLTDMTVYAVDIGPDEEIGRGQFAIELSDAQANEIHRVCFKNGKPAAYEVDD